MQLGKLRQVDNKFETILSNLDPVAKEIRLEWAEMGVGDEDVSKSASTHRTIPQGTRILACSLLSPVKSQLFNRKTSLGSFPEPLTTELACQHSRLDTNVITSLLMLQLVKPLNVGITLPEQICSSKTWWAPYYIPREPGIEHLYMMDPKHCLSKVFLSLGK